MYISRIILVFSVPNDITAPGDDGASPSAGVHKNLSEYHFVDQTPYLQVGRQRISPISHLTVVILSSFFDTYRFVFSIISQRKRCRKIPSFETQGSISPAK